MITRQELDVLEHTSRTGRYVTDEEFVHDMAVRGLLNDHGGTSFWTQGTRGYTLSQKGCALLNEHYKNLCRFPQPRPKRPASEQFVAWRQYLGATYDQMTFPTFLKEVWPNRSQWI